MDFIIVLIFLLKHFYNFTCMVKINKLKNNVIIVCFILSFLMLPKIIHILFSNLLLIMSICICLKHHQFLNKDFVNYFLTETENIQIIGQTSTRKIYCFTVSINIFGTLFKCLLFYLPNNMLLLRNNIWNISRFMPTYSYFKQRVYCAKKL